MMESIGHIPGRTRGSALILTVVLTSLLAIVGVLFVMATRIDKMASTAAVENHELSNAVDTVVTQISQALAEDVPQVTDDQEYYDYPDANNPWLADLEPYAEDGKYYWRQITNLEGLLTTGTRNIPITKDDFVGERDGFANSTDAADPNVLADADGDGVADAKWFRVPDVMTSKGKRFYAAVRIVDNGGMLNVNTGSWFDPNDPNIAGIDGSSPLQVNVLTLAAAPDVPPKAQDKAVLLGTRANETSNSAVATDLARYEKEVIWRYLDVSDEKAPGVYTPFDMSDELELRYRYLLDQDKTTTRVENWGRFRTSVLSTPVDKQGDVNAWFSRVILGDAPETYAYRHVTTTYNMDRILTPKPVDPKDGIHAIFKRMVNVNTADKDSLRKAIEVALSEMDPNASVAQSGQTEIQTTAAQITANLLDYIDDDDEVTVIEDRNVLTSSYYGFERPCVYISEVACQQKVDQAGTLHSSYAIELYKPYFEDKDPVSGVWTLNLPESGEIPVDWSGSRRFHVIVAEDPQSHADSADTALSNAKYLSFADAEEPADTMPLYGYSKSTYTGQPQRVSLQFKEGDTITLTRKVPVGAGERDLIVDQVKVPAGWMQQDGFARSIQRDISPHKCIRRLWAPATSVSLPSLGHRSNGDYVDQDRPEIIQAHPANKPLTNIGELGRIFCKNAYLPEDKLEADVLLDLANPAYSRLFNYLTVIDPAQHLDLDPDETRIMGRININTAPAFVLAQLPWLSYGNVPPAGDSYAAATSRALQRAEEVVKYRDAHGPYHSTGDLMQVAALRSLGADEADNGHHDSPPGPDLTPDTARDDFEERDLLFTRISDLVTVRSDVFTAYILVRVGEAGPQRRLIAIFDRSRVNSGSDQVRVLAEHPVPDPR